MKPRLSFLIIEDDKYSRLNLREILQPFGAVDEAGDVPEALAKLRDYTYDIVVTDIELGDGSGVELIPVVVKRGSHCIVVSSYEGEEVIETAYSRGARHYLSKFRLKDQLPVYVHKFLMAKNARFQKFITEDFITQDPELVAELERLCEINWKNQALLIEGPTGTGKSLFGKLVHEMTNPEGNLVHLNCSELSEQLLESELFGHEKGAFTGADQKKEGKLKLAHGGTLFLDEVATMSLGMQQKLLKAIDEKTFYPVGGTQAVRSEFTLVTATCEDLAQKIKDREFREDFFYRISGFRLKMKPLSERPRDVDLLVKRFQSESARRFVVRPDALEALRAHPWPGNVRELKKACERFSQSSSGIIDLSTVRLVLPGTQVALRVNDSWEDHVRVHGLRSYIAEVEKRAVEESMKRNQGKITACIKELKISTSAFYRILQENQLQL